MAQTKPQYEVVNEFEKMAKTIIDKYPSNFFGIEADKICCVKITNKDCPSKKQDSIYWSIDAVRMPMKMHNAYDRYITVYASQWDALSEKYKYLLIAEMLCSVPTGEESDGKINPFDSKGYKLMQRTFGGIDYMQNPNIPHIINEDINWLTTAAVIVKKEDSK